MGPNHEIRVQVPFEVYIKKLFVIIYGHDHNRYGGIYFCL